MFCPECGTDNRPEARFCARCGATLSEQPVAWTPPSPPPSPGVAGGGGVGATQAGGLGQRKLVIGGVVAGVIVLLVICAAAVVFVGIPMLTGKSIFSGLAGGDQILLAFPDRDGDIDLYLLKLGQDQDEGTLLAEEVTWASTDFELLEDERYRGMGGTYGGFVPDSDRLLLWYELDGDVVIQQMRVGDKEPTEVMESGDDLEWGTVVNDFAFIFLEEFRDGEERCYVARPGGETERVAKADSCEISLDGSMIYFSERDEDELTLSMIDINGENETVLLDGVEGADSYRVSGDASHIAYVLVDDDESQLYLVERRTGEEVEVGDEVFRVTRYGFVPGSDVLYYVVKEDEDDDEVQLYTSDSDEPIAEEAVISTQFSPDGRYLAYLVEDEDGEGTLYVHPMRGGEDVEVLDGEDVRFEVFRTAPVRLLILILEDDDGFVLLSANVDGSDLVELLDEDDATWEGLDYLPNDPTLYIRVEDEDGEVSLFVTPVHRDTGFYLLEGWASIELLNRSPDGSQLVFWAREDVGDDPVLYSIAVKDGAEPVELDDDGEGFRNAVFTSNGRFIIYTADTDGDPDDVEVRRVRADGEEKYEVLYEEARLIDVRWDDIDPFDR